MAVILKMGQKIELPGPWYETETLTCPKCKGDFLLERGDVPANWFVVGTGRDGKQSIKGQCPCCHETVTVARKS